MPSPMRPVAAAAQVRVAKRVEEVRRRIGLRGRVHDVVADPDIGEPEGLGVLRGPGDGFGAGDAAVLGEVDPELHAPRTTPSSCPDAAYDAPRMLDLPPGEGVLPDQLLARAIDAGAIDAEPFTIPKASIQPASLDLRLGEVAYRIRCSFLPARQPVEHRLKDLVIDELDLRGDGVVLETNRPYLIPLKERLRLPAGIRGKANPKSSTGRADVFTRVITDDSARFDEIAAGYHGGLWLEVVPLSFPIRVREDLTLNQLRLAVGRS